MSADASNIAGLARELTAFREEFRNKSDALSALVKENNEHKKAEEEREVSRTVDIITRLNAIQLSINAMLETLAKPSSSRAKKPATPATPTAEVTAPVETTQDATPTAPVVMTASVFYKKAFASEYTRGIEGPVRALTNSIHIPNANKVVMPIEQYVLEDPESIEANNKTLNEIKTMPDGPQKLALVTKFYGGVAVKIFRNLDKQTKETLKKMASTYEWPKDN